jgi:hypothetical protein
MGRLVVGVTNIWRDELKGWNEWELTFYTPFFTQHSNVFHIHKQTQQLHKMREIWKEIKWRKK